MKRLLSALAVTALSAGVLATSAQAGPHNHGHDDHEHVTADASPAQVLEGRAIQADDHVIGAADAPAEMVVYASVTCGHCGRWFTEDWPAVKSELVETGRLRVALREFPTSPAEVAVAGFMIANCGKESDYWPNIERQFTEQEDIRAAFAAGQGREAFEALAAESGVQDLQACLSNDAEFARIDRAMARGEAAGVNAVPAFFLDGKALDGAHTAEAIAEALGG